MIIKFTDVFVILLNHSENRNMFQVRRISLSHGSDAKATEQRKQQRTADFSEKNFFVALLVEIF